MKQLMLMLVVILFLINNSCNCARILAVLPTPSISHMVIYRPILKELSLRGHQIVAIIPDPINDPLLVNLTEINVHEESYSIWASEDILGQVQFEKKFQIMEMYKLTNVIVQYCDAELGHPEVQNLINNPKEHFDIVINEWLMYPSTFMFGEHFKAPIIGICSMSLLITGYERIGSPTHPAYALDFFRFAGDDLTFVERLDNAFYAVWLRLFYFFYTIPKHTEIAKKYFGENIPSLYDVEDKVQLMLVNTNPLFHVARPQSPAVIEIGGIHHKELKRLPQDLEKFLNESSEGVIYFSLGSNVKSISLPEEIRNVFLKVFENLPYKVLWKWESDILPGKSLNIKTSKWFPQQDVLNHPNIKLFITQGGLQSVEESIRAKVPILGIPFAGDQEPNIRRVSSLKIGKGLNFEEITIEILISYIKEIITNESYKKNVEDLSNVFWDQPMKPLDKAIWWIEYVIRHKGAKGLKSPLAKMSWFQFLLIDIFIFIFTILLSLYFVVRIIVQFMITKVFGNFKTDSKLKKNN